MTAATPLDTAHAAMTAAPGDAAARLAFFDALTAVELFLMLETEAAGDRIRPETYTTAEGRFVLAFDTEERLARFAGRVAPYAALPGRAVASMLAGQGIGIALNPDAAPSAMLLPAEAVDWLAETLAHRPEEVTARPETVAPPTGLPARLLGALDTRLGAAAGLAEAAYLAAATYAGGGRGHILAVIGAEPGAQDSLAQAVAEALTFSGVDAGRLDVTFLDAADPAVARLARVGLRLDLTAPPAPAPPPPAAPGSDPEKPPRLR